MRYGVDAEISREDLAELIAALTVLLPREKHRNGHLSAFQRWDCGGGRATLRLYGTSWFSALSLKRWGRITAEVLARARVNTGRTC